MASDLAPRVFIGSSGEARELAHRIKDLLEPDIQAQVWDDNIFELGQDNLGNLLQFTRSFDFAILVFHADDKTTSRGETRHSPRDNVVFELGLCAGALGRRRAFMVIARGKADRLKIPSDLLGVSSVDLDSRALQNQPAYLGERIRVLKDAILRRWAEAEFAWLPSTGLATGYWKNFILPVCRALVDATELAVGDRPVDIRQNAFDFNVVIPRDLARAGLEGRQAFVQKRGLMSTSVASHGRPYPFFVDATVVGDRLQLIDYPTTLSASYEAVQLLLGSGALTGRSEEHRRLEAKEIANFQKTIEIFLQKEEAVRFSDRVHMAYD